MFLDILTFHYPKNDHIRCLRDPGVKKKAAGDSSSRGGDDADDGTHSKYSSNELMVPARGKLK